MSRVNLDQLKRHIAMHTRGHAVWDEYRNCPCQCGCDRCGRPLVISGDEQLKRAAREVFGHKQLTAVSLDCIAANLNVGRKIIALDQLDPHRARQMVHDTR
jgi:hypothetical protein